MPACSAPARWSRKQRCAARSALPPRKAMARASRLPRPNMSSDYLYSPYASQFADAFVSGVITLHMAISQDKLADITAMMDPEREKVIYLRIARRAAIDGLADLSAFASARAEQGRDGIHNQDDPRAQLYSSLSTVTSGTIDEVRAKLGKIDRSQLSQSDRDLLDAAQAVAGEVIAPPAPLPAEKPAPAAAKQEPVKTRPRQTPTSPSCRRSKAQCRSSQPLHPPSRSQPTDRRRQRTGRAGTERARDKGAGSTCSRRRQRCRCCRAGIGARRRRRAGRSHRRRHGQDASPARFDRPDAWSSSEMTTNVGQALAGICSARMPDRSSRRRTTRAMTKASARWCAVAKSAAPKSQASDRSRTARSALGQTQPCRSRQERNRTHRDGQDGGEIRCRQGRKRSRRWRSGQSIRRRRSEPDEAAGTPPLQDHLPLVLALHDIRHFSTVRTSGNGARDGRTDRTTGARRRGRFCADAASVAEEIPRGIRRRQQPRHDAAIRTGQGRTSTQDQGQKLDAIGPQSGKLPHQDGVTPLSTGTRRQATVRRPRQSGPRRR